MEYALEQILDELRKIRFLLEALADEQIEDSDFEHREARSTS